MSEQKDFWNHLGQYIEDSRSSFEEMLKTMVEIPTISAHPDRKDDIRRGAEAAADLLRRFGATAQIYETSGNPVVSGGFRAPNAEKTVTIYNHMDVQPADEPEWVRSPFQFEIEGDKYFGRGSTDDKGPALAGLLAAAYSVKSGIPVNIQFIWEFEEEIGSRNFTQFLKARKEDLKTDTILVVDSVWLTKERPSVCYSLRGNITGAVFIEVGKTDIHSGVSGGIAKNPVLMLADIAAHCCNAKTGEVFVPGFYEDVERVSKEEIENFARSGFDLKEWAETYGLKRLYTEDSMEALLRSWCRPTFEVISIIGGYAGPGVKTAIAPRAEMKFSCRIVPNQDPEKVASAVEQHIRAICPEADVRIFSKMPPYIGPFQGPLADLAASAIQFGFGKEPAFIRAGGSIGAVSAMRQHLDAPITMIGLSLPEHGYHAPNEYFDWGQAAGGIRTFLHYFDSLSRMQ